MQDYFFSLMNSIARTSVNFVLWLKDPGNYIINEVKISLMQPKLLSHPLLGTIQKEHRSTVFVHQGMQMLGNL